MLNRGCHSPGSAEYLVGNIHGCDVSKEGSSESTCMIPMFNTRQAEGSCGAFLPSSILERIGPPSSVLS